MSRRESDFERLQQRLQESEASREEAEQRARQAEASREKAEQRARQTEASQEQAEASRKQAEASREEAVRLVQPTTFEEYLVSCHELSSRVTVQEDQSQTTKGSFTDPKDKIHPTYLRPWEDFAEHQQRIFHDIQASLQSPSAPQRLFSSISFLRELDRILSRRKLASERDLEGYLRIAVEFPVTDIISKLVKDDTMRRRFDLANGIAFENHVNTLSDLSEEVEQRLHVHDDESLTADPTATKSKPYNADQICVYKNLEGSREVRFIIEYKAPHKLSRDFLQRGLRSMELADEVINRSTISTDSEAKLSYNADRMTAAAVTQTFAYMMENGLEYSYITTGEAFVFLRVKQDDPTTVYYHLVEPSSPSVETDIGGVDISRTAIGHTLGFSLMALQSQPRSQRWRRHAISRLRTWAVDFNVVLSQIPEEELAPTPPSSIFKTSTRPLHARSPYRLRKRRPRSRSSCESNIVVREDSSPSSDDQHEEGRADFDTPSKPSKNVAATTPAIAEVPSSEESQRQYCTQRCLLGLMRGAKVDLSCPNILSHRSIKTDQHSIRGNTFTRLVQQQLSEDLDHNCAPLGLQGARGALFRITLASHGYTFVAKGTVKAFVSDLKHEGMMYRKLGNLQGEAVPVYLGNIDLDYCYYLDVGVRIVHMVLMSWAGEQVEETEMTQIMTEEVRRTITRLQQEGVSHEDIRGPNILWDPQRTRPMLVDFERSIVKGPVEALRQMVPNAKRARAAAKELGKGKGSLYS
ncbi:MAG: hypothetical protein M1817_003884 [Caeruleum heppii]|nr:MAG: hypothetical protein M1817_003884 [Caeruleum heppii]